MLALVGHLDHVRDDQLGHDLEDNVACELLCRAALCDEAKRMFQELNQTLAWLDGHLLLLGLLLTLLLDLNSLLERLLLAKVQR